MLPNDVKGSIQSIYKSILRQPGFRSRLGQKVMIAEIANTLGSPENRIIVAEAPTGTGKSLAYLTAAIPVALATNKKIIISTSTVALQEQIASKDLPKFLAISGLGVEYVVAKGRGRYLCPVKLSEKTGFSGRQTDLFGTPVDALRPERAFQAMHDDLESGVWDGDRDSFQIAVSDEDWYSLVMDSRGCLGSTCRFRGQCPFLVARESIGRADIVITNHDLLLSDLSLGGGVILPSMGESILIVDEAHSLPKTAMNHFGNRFSLSALMRNLSDLPHLIGDSASVAPGAEKIQETSISEARELSLLLKDISSCLDRGFPKAEAAVEMVDGRKQTRFLRGVIPSVLLGQAGAAYSVSSSLSRLLKRLTKKMKNAVASGASPHSSVEVLIGQLGGVLASIEIGMKVLENFSTPDADGKLVARWVEAYSGRGGVDHVLEFCPTDVSGFLYGCLWSEVYGAVVTSATITALGRFEHFRRRAGLPYEPGAVYQKLPSPFDYSRASLTVPTHESADPSDYASHTAYISLVLPDIASDKSAGSLVLFSSRRQLRDVLESVPDEYRQIVLCQDDMPRNVLLEEHRARIDRGLPSVIFGLASFAEGVDLPGDLCTAVVIAKLPFDPPGSPAEATLAEAIEARGGNVFHEVILPQAVLRLIQAVGRLLRSEDDRGEIYILDSRVRKKRYGKQILASLPEQLRIVA